MNWRYRKISQEAKEVLLSLCDNSQQFSSCSHETKRQNRRFLFLPCLPLSRMGSISKRSQTIESSKIEIKKIELSTFLHQSFRLESKRFVEIPKKTLEPKIERNEKKFSLPQTKRSIGAILMKNKLKMGIRKIGNDRSRVKTCK